MRAMGFKRTVIPKRAANCELGVSTKDLNYHLVDKYITFSFVKAHFGSSRW